MVSDASGPDGQALDVALSIAATPSDSRHFDPQAFHPDGSRTGSYSYVDPKGETILVKYRADRFGFHVLDGSSIPSTMPHLASPPSNAPSGASAESSDYVRTS